ncbi:MAG: hypothetical protein AMXMBFR83_03880 [Phycisphaerae bacterium]
MYHAVMTEPPGVIAAQRPPFKVRLRDWLELCRAPNAFTAVADPLAGALVCGAGWRDTGRIIIVMLASAFFYAGGIVLNDWHDYKRDLRERPHRPLPSGRIARFRALLAGSGLLILGQVLASALETATGGVGLLLVAAILLYDVLLKEIPIAPAIMGLCRALNLVLGMTVATGEGSSAPAAYLAVVMGLYVLGITVFARHEAGLARKDQLLLGAAFTAAAMAMLASVVPLFRERGPSPLGLIWLGLLAAALGYRMARAILRPAPARIQAGVKLGVLGIILLDATLVGFFRGLGLSLLVAVLLVPAVWLGKWLYST